MKCAAIFLTDKKYLGMTRYAANIFMINNNIDVIIYCDGFTAPPPGIEISSSNNKDASLIYKEIKYDATCGIPENTHLSRTMLGKLSAINDAIRHYDRIVYMDGDVLSLSKIPVEDMVFDGKPIAAVYDIAEMGCVTDRDFTNNIRRNNLSDQYFNSGIIFVDGPSWDEPLFTYLYNLYLSDHEIECKFKNHCSTPDQCALNMVFKDNWKALPLSFNMQACAMFCDHWTDASVRHYVGPRKFYPLRLGRNDARDVAALNAARKIMGLNPVRLPFSEMFYRLNKFRHKKYSDRIKSIMDNLEKNRINISDGFMHA